MDKTMFSEKVSRPSGFLIPFLLFFIFSAGLAVESEAATLDERYPGLAAGLLKSAVLEPLDDDTLLVAEGVVVGRSELLEGIDEQEPVLRAQLEKNLIFLLEQEAVRRILLEEARKAGIAVDSGDDAAIQALFEHRTKDATVSQDEARAFYESNKETVGGAPFEQVEDGIRQYLLQDAKQRAVEAYLDSLDDKYSFKINEKWAESQSRMAMDNPVDNARRSGKPTMVEFGAKGCVPCDMMQPVLDKLRADYPEKLNVVFVHVGQEQLLAARFGIRSIPVQVFYDAKGKEVFRHVGYFAQTEVDRQLLEMGVRK